MAIYCSSAAPTLKKFFPELLKNSYVQKIFLFIGGCEIVLHSTPDHCMIILAFLSKDRSVLTDLELSSLLRNHPCNY